MKRLGENSSLWEITCFLTCSLPSSLLKYLLKSLQSLGISPKSWVVTICGRVIYVLLGRVICVCFPMQSPRQGKKETVYNFLFFGDTCLVCSYVCTDACVEVNPGVSLQHSHLTV